MTTVGHNSVPGADLVKFVQRVENIDDQVDALKDDRKEVFAEAKAAGFDVKIMRKVIARRKRDKAELAEEDSLIAVYEDRVNEVMKELLSD